MTTPLGRLRLIKANYDRFCYDSSEEYREALRDLALGIAFMQATAEAVTADQLDHILVHTEELLAAGRVNAKVELRQQAPSRMAPVAS